MTAEEKIHCAVADYLRQTNTSAVWFHPANGGKRNVIEAKKLKRMGVLPGVSDFIFLKDGQAFALELKSDEGRLTPKQSEFLERWQDSGGESAWTKGIDSAIAMLKHWEIV